MGPSRSPALATETRTSRLLALQLLRNWHHQPQPASHLKPLSHLKPIRPSRSVATPTLAATASWVPTNEFPSGLLFHSLFPDPLSRAAAVNFTPCQFFCLCRSSVDLQAPTGAPEPSRSPYTGLLSRLPHLCPLCAAPSPALRPCFRGSTLTCPSAWGALSRSLWGLVSYSLQFLLKCLLSRWAF